MVGLIYYLVGDRSVAEDVLQDSIERVLRWGAANPAQEPTLALLYQIAKNKAKDHMRKAGRDSRLLHDLSQGRPDAPVSADPATGYPPKDALSKLPPADAEAFRLCGIAKYSSREAGALLRLPDSTVRYLKAKAVTFLRSELTENDEPGRADGPR